MIEADRERDVLIGYCHQGSLTAHFHDSILQAFATDAAREHRRLNEYNDANGHFIHDNRSRIATYFLDHTDYQWLWFLDVDVKFDDTVIYTMLEAAERNDAKLLAAPYWNKYDHSGTYLSWFVATDTGFHPLETLPEDELVPITACGMGCTLIHRDVLTDVRDFQRAKLPDDPWDTFGADLIRYDDGNSIRMGEDITFCLRAGRQGHQTYGLTTLVVEHFKPAFMAHGAAPTGMVAA